MERELGCGTAREPDTRGPTGTERSKRPCSQHWYVDEYGGVPAACMRGALLSRRALRSLLVVLSNRSCSLGLRTLAQGSASDAVVA